MKIVIISYGEKFHPLACKWIDQFNSVHTAHSDLILYTSIKDFDVYNKICDTVHAIDSEGFPLSGTRSTILKTKAFIEAFQYGDYIYTDLDAFWFGDVTETVNEYLKEYDMVFSIATHPKSYPAHVREILGMTLCTGFFAVTKNDATVRFFNNVNDIFERDLRENDQYWINDYLLKDREFLLTSCEDKTFDLYVEDHDLKIKLLDENIVYRGNSLDVPNRKVWHPIGGAFDGEDKCNILESLGCCKNGLYAK